MRNERAVSVQRLMALRQYPGFAEADLAEFAVFADNVVDTHIAAGNVITRAGRVPSLHLVVDGRVDHGGTSYGPRALVGALEAMAGRALTTPLVAAADSHTLELGAADFADILEDNFGLLSNVRRTVARRLLALRRRHGIVPRPQIVASNESLGLVDRLVALRRQPVFASGRIQALVALAQATREVEWDAGTVVTHTGDLARSAYVVLEGALRTHGRVLGPGDALGMLESLAEAPFHEASEAITRVRALECPTPALFDVIEDHTELALAMIASLAGEILDVSAEPEVESDPTN